MVELVAAHGFEAVTVRGLAKRARVSSGTFYKHYSSTADCLLCTFDLICARASTRMIEAGQEESEPRQRLAAAAERLYRDIAAAPEAATFMLRSAHTVGPAYATDLWNSAMQLGAAVELCIRGEDGPPLNPLLLEGIVAGLARIGSTVQPASGEEELRRVAAEAVEWTMCICDSPAADLDPSDLAARVEDTPGESGSRPRRGDDWGAVLGDAREMILGATLWIARGGYQQLSIPRICREAGVSRRDFRRYFDSLEECFVVAVEERAAQVVAASVRRRDGNTPGTRTVSGVLRSTCEAIESDPDGARVLLDEITAAGTRGIDSRDRMIARAAHSLRATASEDEEPSEVLAEASIVAVWAILRRQVQDRNPRLAGALPVMNFLILRQAG